MPSTYTHYRFGRELFDLCDGEVKQVIRRHKELFLIGLHGPDILFYYGPLYRNKVNSVGYELHSKIATEFFDNARQRIRTMNDSEAGLAYILGFICHFTLDSECHGYIEYVINQGKLTHTEIETDFERQLMQRDGKTPVKFNPTKQIVAKEEYAYIISGFFKGISSYQVYRSLQGMKWYNGLLLPTNWLKCTFVKGLLRITNNYKEMHGLLISNEANPECKGSTKELARRYKGAIVLAVHLMEEFYKKRSGEEALSRRFDRTFGPDSVEMNRYEQGAYNV